MTLKEIYSSGRDEIKSDKTYVVSFEIFPPKNDDSGEKLEKLISHLEILKEYNPAFVSLTYGAGGTTQNASLNIIKRIQAEIGVRVMPHFTCVGTSRVQVQQYLAEIKDLGIKDILALRGDIPVGVEQKNFDFKHANELVDFIKSKTDLSIGVAGYPEGHMECKDFFQDLLNLKIKVDAGADAIYTQMFFDNNKYFSFVEKAQNLGIDIPIIPGILPIRSFEQLEKMLSMAKVTVPNSLMKSLEKFKDNKDDIRKVGIDFAVQQCQELLANNVKGLHFYTLNTSSSVSKILDNI